MQTERPEFREWNRENDYSMLAGWWMGHDQNPVPSSILPAGIIIGEVGGVGVAAASVYLDNSSPVAYVGWVLSNPEASPNSIHAAIKAMPDAVERFCLSQGRCVACFVTGNRGAGKLFEKSGWIPEHPATEFWKLLKEPDVEKGGEPCQP